jgi:hypothetical protein
MSAFLFDDDDDDKDEVEDDDAEDDAADGDDVTGLDGVGGRLLSSTRWPWSVMPCCCGVGERKRCGRSRMCCRHRSTSAPQARTTSATCLSLRPGKTSLTVSPCVGQSACEVGEGGQWPRSLD